MPTADEDRIELRRAEALRLRCRGYSVREIGRELGISKSVAAEDVRHALGDAKKLSQEELDSERSLELHRTDNALRIVAKILDGIAFGSADDAAAAAESAGLEPVDMLLDSSELKLKAIDRQVKLQDQRAKLLGLYAPTKQEHSGPEGAPIAIDARNALIERLARGVAGAAPAGAAERDPSKPVA